MEDDPFIFGIILQLVIFLTHYTSCHYSTSQSQVKHALGPPAPQTNTTD